MRWVLIAWCVIHLRRDEEPRWWLAIGAIAGLALQTKYSIAFELAGVLVGMQLTDARRHLANAWFWAGGGVALLRPWLGLMATSTCVGSLLRHRHRIRRANDR
ncbi:glycosyltransferase family 39 protein [Dyella jiangningensis]